MAPLTNNLTPEKALIFRITHVDNVPWILENGIPCKSSGNLDPSFVSIGNAELIERRSNREIPIAPAGTLSDYVPFYFTPYSPMMLNIKSGYGEVQKRSNSEIAILVSSLHKVSAAGVDFVFTDRHAYLEAASYYNDVQDLHQVDFELIRTKDFKRDAEDPGKFERYQAEALIHTHLPAEALLGVGCYKEAQRKHFEETVGSLGLEVRAVTQPSWYF